MTGIVPVADKGIIMAMGWNRTITTYDNEHPEVTTYQHNISRHYIFQNLGVIIIIIIIQIPK